MNYVKPSSILVSKSNYSPYVVINSDYIIPIHKTQVQTIYICDSIHNF